VDEIRFRKPLPPLEYCQELARIKAEAIASAHPDALVIGADTIVVLDDIIIEKPVSFEDAEKMLNQLSGRTHRVYTGVSLQCIQANLLRSFVECTEVTFTELAPNDIRHYIIHYPPFDKAGSYGIQDWSAVFVERISGCYNNVVGFPVFRFYQELKWCLAQFNAPK